MEQSQRYRLGVDIGGTFTDLIVFDGATRAFALGKTLTTLDDPSLAIEIGLGELLGRAGGILADGRVALADVGQIIHGTTLVTNALIERKAER